MGALRDSNGTAYTNDAEKAELLNSYFASTCVKDNGTLPPFDKRIPAGDEFDNVIFTPENVLRVLRKLKSSKSSGPDGFPSDLFKKLASHLAFPLSMLFNNCMSVVKIPAEWKSAIITPVAKSGCKDVMCSPIFH